MKVVINMSSLLFITLNSLINELSCYLNFYPQQYTTDREVSQPAIRQEMKSSDEA